MLAQPFQVSSAHPRRGTAGRKPRLLIAGATGVLGSEVLGALVGQGQFETTQVLTREPITMGLGGVAATVVESDCPADWPAGAADTGVILFEPPRLFNDRERALWTPRPQQLPQLAAWMRRSAISSVAIVLPHAQGRLPEALKRGLASLDEQAVAALGFERLLIVRSAQKPAAATLNGPARIASWMLSSLRYMLPSSEQPAPPAKIAEFVAAALQLAPPGIHVAAPQTVREAALGDPRAAVLRWLHP